MNTTDITYRKATQEDTEVLIKLRLDYLREERKDMSSDEEKIITDQLQSYFKNEINKNFIAIFAESGNNVIASAFLTIFEKPANPAFITGRTATLLNVFTYPEYRERSIAAQTVQMIIDEAKKLNISFIELYATASGKPLYEKLGFEEKQSKYTPMRLQLVEDDFYQKRESKANEKLWRSDEITS